MIPLQFKDFEVVVLYYYYITLIDNVYTDNESVFTCGNIDCNDFTVDITCIEHFKVLFKCGSLLFTTFMYNVSFSVNQENTALCVRNKHLEHQVQELRRENEKSKQRVNKTPMKENQIP